MKRYAYLMVVATSGYEVPLGLDHLFRSISGTIEVHKGDSRNEIRDRLYKENFMSYEHDLIYFTLEPDELY